MAHWEKKRVIELEVGHIVKDAREGYIGGIVRTRDGARDVRWLKWDPTIEAPMLDTLYLHTTLTIETVERDEDETDREFTKSVEHLLEKSLGRVFPISEFIYVMDRYAR